MAKKEPQLIQTEFIDTLFPKEVAKSEPNHTKNQNERRPLSRKQQAGFRADYNKAMITLYAVGCLFNTPALRKEMPEEIRNEFEKAKKTQERYERYMPKAAQNIVHYGRDVVDAYMSPDDSYLRFLENQAERSKYPDKRHMCQLSKKIVDKIVDIVRLQNEII